MVQNWKATVLAHVLHLLLCMYTQSSLLLVLFLRKKIDAIVARGGGIPDRDAPEVLEECKFWCVIEECRTDSCIMEWPCYINSPAN